MKDFIACEGKLRYELPFFIFFEISKNFSPNGLPYLLSKFIKPYELNEYDGSPVDNDLFSFDNFIKSKFLFFLNIFSFIDLKLNIFVILLLILYVFKLILKKTKLFYIIIYIIIIIIHINF